MSHPLSGRSRLSSEERAYAPMTPCATADEKYTAFSFVDAMRPTCHAERAFQRDVFDTADAYFSRHRAQRYRDESLIRDGRNITLRRDDGPHTSDDEIITRGAKPMSDTIAADEPIAAAQHRRCRPRPAPLTTRADSYDGPSRHFHTRRGEGHARYGLMPLSPRRADDGLLPLMSTPCHAAHTHSRRYDASGAA